MMRQTIFENRKRQTSFLAFVFVLKNREFRDFFLYSFLATVEWLYP